ncbi:MAG: hypothetical protein L3J11_10530 [Draconibacterium sp.]|nr:hypothetical protein [Draconibacterium sp.]
MFHKIRKVMGKSSFCVAAFLLAETGFLDNKSASTHSASADQFREKYPAINLNFEAVISKKMVFIQVAELFRSSI